MIFFACIIIVIYTGIGPVWAQWSVFNESRHLSLPASRGGSGTWLLVRIQDRCMGSWSYIVSLYNYSTPPHLFCQNISLLTVVREWLLHFRFYIIVILSWLQISFHYWQASLWWWQCLQGIECHINGRLWDASRPFTSPTRPPTGHAQKRRWTETWYSRDQNTPVSSYNIVHNALYLIHVRSMLLTLCIIIHMPI